MSAVDAITQGGCPMPDSSPPHDDRWDGSLDRVRAVLREWRDDHPRATFTEIEAAVDAERQRVRARLVAEAAGRLATQNRCGVGLGLSDLRRATPHAGGRARAR